jgi:hypothetical protein
MKKSILGILSSLFLVFASINPAQADEPVRGYVVHQDYSFFVNSFTDRGGRIYYEPTALEHSTRAFLRKLGAKDVSVRVSGIPNRLVLNPQVFVRFDSIQLPPRGRGRDSVQARWKEVRFSGFDNGHLARELFRGVSSRFEIRDLKGDVRRGGDAYRFQMKTLFAE